MDIIHAFIEAYYNGFYEMQTPLETAAAYLGDIAYHIINLK
jgi:hypothetical protein